MRRTVGVDVYYSAAKITGIDRQAAIASVAILRPFNLFYDC